MKNSDKKFAVITGASQGLGLAFAEKLAAQNFNLVLISLPDQELSNKAIQLADINNIEVHFYETDLTKKENVLSLCIWLNENFEIFMLINNAGIGGTCKFTDASVQYIDTILQLNVVATSLLTHQLLPNLLKQPEAYILNISSLAAFSPIAYKTVYPASKNFIYSFSLGLSEELKDTNVVVSVVNPGGMATNKSSCQVTNKLGFWGKQCLLKPEKVAEKCLKKLLNKERVIRTNFFSWLAITYLPVWIKLPLLSNNFKRFV